MVHDKYFTTDEYKSISIELLVENLPSLRARIGITQEELANVLGVSRQTYYSLENRNREMSWSMFLSIVFIFDSIEETHEMIRDLRIFPIDLFLRFNGKLEVTDVK